MAKPKTSKPKTSQAKTSQAKTIIDEDAKKAMYAIEHLELDLREVKKYLKKIEEYGHEGGGSVKGASRELSHTGTSKDASNELSHTGVG
jgi:hypothetical protein